MRLHFLTAYMIFPRKFVTRSVRMSNQIGYICGIKCFIFFLFLLLQSNNLQPINLVSRVSLLSKANHSSVHCITLMTKWWLILTITLRTICSCSTEGWAPRTFWQSALKVMNIHDFLPVFIQSFLVFNNVLKKLSAQKQKANLQIIHGTETFLLDIHPNKTCFRENLKVTSQ